MAANIEPHRSDVESRKLWVITNVQGLKRVDEAPLMPLTRGPTNRP
jgi:hypothetical protein